MIFTAVPLSVVGGIMALWIRGMPFSISAGIGFIALFGVAVLNGIVLIEHLKHLQNSGMTDMDALVIKGTSDRLRPVILTASAAAMGFLPMAVSTGAGAEVQRPLATVVIGGLITSTMLTMIVLPLLFKVFRDEEGLKYKMVRIFKLKNLIIPLLLAISGTLSAQSPAYTLEQCIDLALKNNKEMGAYNLKIEERKALAMPFMSMEKTRVYYGYDQANLGENGYPLPTIGVEQSLLFPTLHGYMNRMEDIEVNIAEQEFEKQRMMLMKSVASAYYTVQFLLEKERYFNRMDSLYAQLNTMAATQFRLGDISQLDKLNVQAKRQQIALEVNKITIDIQNAYGNLKAMMQSDENFRIANDEMKMEVVQKPDLDKSPEAQQYRLRSEYLKTNTKAEQHRLLPDISLEYFYGKNRYENTRGYHGFQVGLGIPLYWSDQRSKIKASRFAFNANELLLQNSLILLETKYKNLESELRKFRDNIEFYNNTGRQLSDEITRTATRSYETGEIDFYQFALSIENALKLTLDYYEAVLEYNRVALEINYLTTHNL